MSVLVERAHAWSVFLLVAGCFSLFLIMPAETLAAESTTLSKQIDALTNALNSDSAKDDSAQTSLIALLKTIGKLDCATDTAKNADCKIAQIAAFVSERKPPTTFTSTQQSVFWTALQSFLSVQVANKDTTFLSAVALATKEIKLDTDHAYEPDAVITGLGNLIAAAIPPVVATKPATTLPKPKVDAMVQTLSAAAKTLDQLRAVLPDGRRINVLGAWYGDVRLVRRAFQGDLSPWTYNERFCSATLAIRARCQGKLACSSAATGQSGGNTPSDGAMSELTGSSLCGYEPAPYAEPRNKGLIVSYECIALDSDGWKQIGINDPVRKDTIHKPLQTLLRSSAVQEIRCQGLSPQ